MNALDSERTGARVEGKVDGGMLVWVDPGSDLPPAAVEVDPELAGVEMAVAAQEETRLSWHMRDTPPPRESCSRAVPGVAVVGESVAGGYEGADVGSVASPLSPPDLRGRMLCKDVELVAKEDVNGAAAAAEAGGDELELSAGVDSGPKGCPVPDDGSIDRV